MPFHPDREELSWAAGFFDGEGCGQTNRESLERFQRAVGGLGKIYGPYARQHKDRWSRKAQWAHRAHRREHVQAVAALLWFKLGPIKRQQATRVLLSYPRRCAKGHPLTPPDRGCPKCVADAWAAKRLAKASIPGQSHFVSELPDDGAGLRQAHTLIMAGEPG